MVTIGIANTLDLPDKLNARICSRMGQNRIVFVPYRSDQMQQIIEKRLKNTSVMKNNAIVYISKKICSVSSDIRKTFNLCRAVIKTKMNSICKQDSSVNQRRYKKPSRKNIKLITLQEVVAEFDSIYGNNVTKMINSSTKIQKVFWICLYNEVICKNDKQVYFSKLHSRVNNLLATLGNARLSHQQFELILNAYIEQGLLIKRGIALDFIAVRGIDEDYRSQGYVKVPRGINSGDYVLLVEADIEDIEFGLRNDDLWIDHRLTEEAAKDIDKEEDSNMDIRSGKMEEERIN